MSAKFCPFHLCLKVLNLQKHLVAHHYRVSIYNNMPWWCHQMETFSESLALCGGNSPVTGEFPTQRPVTQSFDVFYDLRLNKWLSKQWWGWWFVTPSYSVESPSMVDPQWNIWYRGSKWNLHTVCWSAVGCEWGTTSVYFGITYVCFIPSRLPVFAVEPQYLLQYFLFLSKVSFELHIQNLQKISCWFKIWMGFVGPILIKLWTSSIWGFL